jgi:hypothetical protein
MSAGWRAALEVYVAGRNRGVTLEEKRRIASRAEAPGAPSPPRTDAAEPGGASYGVGVPEKLEYYRNAGTWRNQLPGGGSHHGGSTGN